MLSMLFKIPRLFVIVPDIQKPTPKKMSQETPSSVEIPQQQQQQLSASGCFPFLSRSKNKKKNKKKKNPLSNSQANNTTTPDLAKDEASGIFQKRYRLVFLCAFDGTPVKCGKDGEGYVFDKDTPLLKKLRPIIHISLLLMKALGAASGVLNPSDTATVATALNIPQVKKREGGKAERRKQEE
jgi:hypothetical protein